MDNEAQATQSPEHKLEQGHKLKPQAPGIDEGDTSLGLARYLAWTSLLLVLGLSVGLAFSAGNIARESLLAKQRDVAALLAENLNNQIYRRFTLPTVVGFGRIAMELPAQYERLDLVVQSVIHGQDVHTLRIFDHSGTINYALDKSLAGRTGLSGPSVEKAKTSDAAIFDLDSNLSYWEAFFNFNLPAGSYYLRTTYPLRIENRLDSSDAEGPVLGVLEFTHDVTKDMRNVLRLQWTIIGFTLAFSLLFVTLLIVFLRRAERALAARVQEKQRLLKELNKNEKLASMGRVTSGIAHEIRNPLGIIRSSAELLLKRSAGEDRLTSSILNAIHDESKRLSQTVTDFLDYARPRMPHYAGMNIGKVLDQALGFMYTELDKLGCTVEKRYTAENQDLDMQGDKDLLYRAVYNILSNSVQAMAEHNTQCAKLLVEVRPFYYTPPRKNAEPEKRLEIRIADNGPGFNDLDKQKFLDPFFTTKDSGTGLGLAIVNSIVSAHNGELLLEDNPEEKGAMVLLRLPTAAV